MIIWILSLGMLGIGSKNILNDELFLFREQCTIITVSATPWQQFFQKYN
jgi:hypothetical protein